ncbi:GlxA family transcriptional regulator [Gallaecimonas kandeliae]|uniref:GlxA family transcriptional regulator n=1 Tax=Gallaecimonas kandeliae TaxID=3029055 RepID=UPI002648CBEF|nr:GlxA family transcriptional regulator [Gallaecimonas kandeliae]WKE64645.1 GlxA family transcriptional regulator [Gallaecimonas kandeliae]
MHNIGYLLDDGFQILALSSQAVFEHANFASGEPFYRIANYSLAGGPVRTSLGMAMDTLAVRADSWADTWIVAGVNDPLAQPASPATLAFLRQAAPKARRLAAICTGTFVLAEAGLLDGKRATTHWALAGKLAERFPAIDVDANRIYIEQGNIWTSAGMTAGLDLALAMVEKDLGGEVARAVAHRLVMNQQRAGGQNQHSEMLALAPRSDRIQSALAYARQHLAQPLTVETLAEAAHLSPRQFSRLFREETGRTPAKAIEGLRLEAARLMLEQSRHSLEEIARETGFRDRRHMREVFIRGFGVSPLVLRKHARTS